MHPSNSSKSGSDIDEADDIEVDWDDGPGFDSIDLLNVELQKFDILCFTETWLNTNVANQDISLDNFQSPFRKDRVDRLGGALDIRMHERGKLGNAFIKFV
jgi:hypothetical protein